MDVLHKFLDKSCADAACEVIEEEALRSPHLFEYATEHPYGKHVEKQMGEPAMHEHVRNQLCGVEVFGKEEMQA